MKKRSSHYGFPTTLALGISVTAMLSACSSGGSLAPVPGGQGAQATGHLRILIPPAAASKKPSYVSPSTMALSVAIDGGAPTFTNLSATSPACAAGGALQPLTCDVPIVASAGTHSLAIITYDKAQTSSATLASGHALSSNTVTATFVAGHTNTVSVTLNGAPTSVIIGSGPTETTANGGNDSLVLAGPLPKTMIAEALDVDGNVIVGPGAPAITIADTSNLVTAAAVPVVGAPTFNTNTFTLTPKLLGTTKLTMTATQAGAGGAVVTVSIPTIVSPILTVANSGSNSITEYVPWSALPAVTVASGINKPIALAADTLGTLYVLNAAATNTVVAYTDGGTTLARTITSGIAGPDAIAVDSANTLYVANASANTVTEYAAGSTTPTATIATGISKPTALAITGNVLYVANYGNNSVTAYTTGTTTAVGMPITSGINGPFGLVLNSAKTLFVANLTGNNITTYLTGGTRSITYIGTTFVDASPFTTPRIPLAVDSTDKIYAVNYGANDVTTYFGTMVDTPATTIMSDMTQPLSAAIDNTNNLYVANQVGTINPNGTITAYAGGGQVNTRTLGGGGAINGPTAVFPLGP